MPVRLGACLLAEFVGTFALCFVGILAIHSGAGLLSVALAHGLILAIMVTAAMPTSGGHFNPAVTFGFLITGKIKPPAAMAYIVIQLLAGTIAALAVYAIFGGGEIRARIVQLGTPAMPSDPTHACRELFGMVRVALRNHRDVLPGLRRLGNGGDPRGATGWGFCDRAYRRC